MRDSYDILVVGAGVGGVSSAVAAAREGAKVLLIEKSNAIGGTGVHAYPGLITRHWADDGRYINAGLHCRFFPEAHEDCVARLLRAWGEERDPDRRQLLKLLVPQLTYESDALARRYQEALDEFPNLEVRTETELIHLRRDGSRITEATVRDAAGAESVIRPKVFIDATFNAEAAVMAEAEVACGRPDDGALQPATLIFTIDNMHFGEFDLQGWPLCSVKSFMLMGQQLTPLYRQLQETGATDNPRPNVLMFVRRDLRSALMNQTRVMGVRPDDPEGMAAARANGERQANEFLEGMRHLHPAFRNAKMGMIATRLGLRDGRRVLGDYTLTLNDCLSGARFPDMIAACANFVDIHSPTKNSEELAHAEKGIGNNGYFHIPYRCLTPRGLDNLLIASRAISGSFEAHGAYRVMAPICAYSEAAGIAAAMAASGDGTTRAVPVRELQERLGQHGQFVETELPNTLDAHIA